MRHFHEGAKGEGGIIEVEVINAHPQGLPEDSRLHFPVIFITNSLDFSRCIVAFFL